MSILGLPKAYGNVRRMREIVGVLLRHGFHHVVTDLNLFSVLPGVTRIKEAWGRESPLETRLSMAERLALVLQDLGASSIKLGQVLATRSDLLPEEYVKAFSKLQDAVDPLPAEAIHSVIESRLGKPVDQLFASFDNQANASGSIGQVHFAILPDGQEVVVKVKRPGTDEQMREDTSLFLALADLAEKHLEELGPLRPRMMIEEFARAMDRELDYVGEASYTEKFHNQYEDEPGLVVPKVYWEYVSRDTLVLERLNGERLSRPDIFEVNSEQRQRVAHTLGQLFMRQYFVNGFFHADPHPGNMFVFSDGRVGLIDFGQMGHLTDELRRKLAMALIALSSGEIDFIVDIFADIGAFSDFTNIREFRSEMATLIDRYYGVPVSRLNIGDVFHEAMNVARSHGIQLPREFVLMSKSFVTVMGLIPKLDPTFSPAKTIEPFRREIFGSIADPRSAVKQLGFYLFRLISLIRRAPEDVRDLMDKARSGQVRVRFQHEGMEPLMDVIETTSRSITVAIIIGAITVGSSIVLASGDAALGAIPLPGTGTEIPATAIVAVTGFMGAVLMGLWLVWNILRRHH